MNILDNFKALFHTFGVRRSIDDLDSENQPGSGSVIILTYPELQGLQRTSDTKNMRTKKKAFIHSIGFQKIHLCLRYRVPNPGFGQLTMHTLKEL